MRNLFIKHFYILIIICCISCSKKDIVRDISVKTTVMEEKYKMPDLSLKIKEAKEFVDNNDMNSDFCILIDLGIHSGRKRFFVWDFNQNEITHEFLVGHGCGDNQWSFDDTKDNPTFSNVVDSHRSSLGKYKLGKRGFSNWGVNINYVMHGLEETNNNALERIIVFHSWEVVSDVETFPVGTPEGWGCPTISNKSFLEIDPLLKNSTKPVLMWIYSSNIGEL